MRGRKPTPLHLKLIRGNPGKHPLHAEPVPTPTATVPDAPQFLAPYAVDEWNRVAPDLHRLGLLTPLDLTCFAAYCQSFARWRTSEEAVADAAMIVPASSGAAAVNPLLRIARNAAADMVRFAGEFGLTPVARARLGSAPSSRSGRGKFDGLLG